MDNSNLAERPEKFNSLVLFLKDNPRWLKAIKATLPHPRDKHNERYKIAIVYFSLASLIWHKGFSPARDEPLITSLREVGDLCDMSPTTAQRYLTMLSELVPPLITYEKTDSCTKIRLTHPIPNARQPQTKPKIAETQLPPQDHSDSGSLPWTSIGAAKHQDTLIRDAKSVEAFFNR